ncbi:hypothetical protein [Ornithinimicrobium tianjinense]|uniref:Uncharacterized protein n=1 Tax=Ornithinimicrobium tianjinense TaxID=1195761 RepID=A0A917BT45_9MICO|nr:hypothetical protein [Ornithinimicrobium tianjinense]GGF57933.1 hypothetical protein GCM10011366_27140 [Ornithinimicrobium tianjinense]
MTSEQLFARARQLETLADDVETVLDGVSATAASPLWDCPHADDVRGQVWTYRNAAQAAARDLRHRAGRVRADAWAAQARERELATTGAPQ